MQGFMMAGCLGFRVMKLWDVLKMVPKPEALKPEA